MDTESVVTQNCGFCVSGVEAEATLGLGEGAWWGSKMSRSGTAGGVKGAAEGEGVAREEAGVAVGGVGLEAEEGAEEGVARVNYRPG